MLLFARNAPVFDLPGVKSSSNLKRKVNSRIEGAFASFFFARPEFVFLEGAQVPFLPLKSPKKANNWYVVCLERAQHRPQEGRWTCVLKSAQVPKYHILPLKSSKMTANAICLKRAQHRPQEGHWTFIAPLTRTQFTVLMKTSYLGWKTGGLGG